jgi:hypothetical protein
MFNSGGRFISTKDLSPRTYSANNNSDGQHKKDAACFLYDHLIIDCKNDVCDIDLMPIYSQCMDDEI